MKTSLFPTFYTHESMKQSTNDANWCSRGTWATSSGRGRTYHDGQLTMLIHLHRQRLDASVLTMKRCPGVARLAAKCAAATSRTSAIKRLRTFCSSHISRCTLYRHSPPDGWCISRFWAAFWVPDSTHPWKHHASALVTMMQWCAQRVKVWRTKAANLSRSQNHHCAHAQGPGWRTDRVTWKHS